MHSTCFPSALQKTQKKEIPPNYQEFWSIEIHNRKHQKKKKTLMFECYNLLDFVE
jgi:hypothetical protein